MWELDYKDRWMPKNWFFELWCWRRLLRVPWTARRSNHSILKEINPDIHWKDWCWRWNSSTLATRCEELTHWKRPWCWEQLKAGGEGDDKGWDGWMASPTWWMWDWANSGSYWWTAKASVLRSMGSQRVGHDWATELNTNVKYTCVCVCVHMYVHIHICVSIYVHTQWSITQPWKEWNLAICSNRDALRRVLC